jgi:MFS family permease
MAANFLFEIPTGAIADFFGRKRSVIIGLWVYAASFLIYFFSQNFWQFLLAEVINALAATCISGALEALVVDSLDFYGYQGKLEALFRRAEVRSIGVIIGAVAGAFVGQYGLAWPWLMSAVSFAGLAAISGRMFHDTGISQSRQVSSGFCVLGRIARESVTYGLNNRALMIAVGFAAILAFTFQAINMYWPIALKQIFAVSTKYMGFIFAGIVAFSFLGAQLSKLWERYLGKGMRSVLLSQVVTLVGIIGCCLISGLPAFLIFFFLHEGGQGLFVPLNRAFVNENIAGKNRATVLSFESMVVKAGSGLGLILSGLIADYLGIMASWMMSGIVLTLGIGLFLKKH